MFIQIMALVAMTIFLFGLVYRVSAWFRMAVSTEAGEIPASRRLAASARGIVGALFSRQALVVARVFLLDVLLQRKIFKHDFVGWLAHMCMFAGFTVLLLMHALGRIITVELFPGYASTLNPFLFLRDFFGALVILGVALAVYRRIARRAQASRTNGRDVYAIIILAVILLSGVLLKATKIVSHSDFQAMAEEYAIQSDEEDLKALEAYWVENYGVVSPDLEGPFDPRALEKGKGVSEMSCAQCHSSSRWAFAGYWSGKLLKPVALALDRWNARSFLWYVHFFASLFGLAYLPFSKMFHIIAAPLSILVNASIGEGKPDPANLATKQALELDACTHCGACTERCSLAVAYLEIPNLNILPSEKMISIRALASGKMVSSQENSLLRQGLHLCTECSRCSSVCPSGIDLTGLWVSARERLLQQSSGPEYLLLTPLAYGRGLMREALDKECYIKPIESAVASVTSAFDPRALKDHSVALAPGDIRDLSGLNGAFKSGAYRNCYRCMSCTLSCPVVLNYREAEKELGLLPHQIMHAVGMRLWDLVFGSKMLLNCLGCYKCQESCPQCVPVADVLCELREMAISRAMEKALDTTMGGIS